MIYHSTRNRGVTADSAQAVLSGLAPDGGLFLPAALPEFDAAACLSGTPEQMAVQILSALLPDIPHMDTLVHRGYSGKFTAPDLTPTVKAGDFTVLELFHGPTSAFKDIALCMLPQLLTAAREVKGQEKKILILTATSGDTGKAALAGFADVPGVGICVFYPDGGVSQIQRLQMATQEGANVSVCAVRGNFDDAQTGVKRIFAACADGKLLESRDFSLSSANSINIGRLAPQIMYYFKAYRDLLDRGEVKLGESVNFSVPTGNFGDILAGYLARELGLPVGRLICASNANNVLTDFLRTGTYDRRRELHKTASPSMDILVSSNLERLLYLLSRDPDLVRSLMEQLSEQGFYTVPASLKEKLDALFWGDFCTDEAGTRIIGRVWADYGYLCDPHTACGWAAAESYRAATGDCAPMVVLSTASPYKFADAVLTGLGASVPEDAFDRMDLLQEKTGVPIPRNLASLKGKPILHRTVLDREEMLPFVLKR